MATPLVINFGIYDGALEERRAPVQSGIETTAPRQAALIPPAAVGRVLERKVRRCGHKLARFCAVVGKQSGCSELGGFPKGGWTSNKAGGKKGKHCNNLLLQCKGSYRYQGGGGEAVGSALGAEREFALKTGVCFNCLKPNHRVWQCKAKRARSKCTHKHHTVLHGTYEAARCQEHQASTPITGITIGTFGCQTPVGEVQLMTAVAVVQGPKRKARVWIFLDIGLQASFVSPALVTVLSPVRVDCQQITVTGFSSAQKAEAKQMASFALIMETDDGAGLEKFSLCHSPQWSHSQKISRQTGTRTQNLVANAEHQSEELQNSAKKNKRTAGTLNKRCKTFKLMYK